MSLAHTGTVDYPHTIAYCIRKQMQIDSFMELPKDKRPPKSIWDDSDELDRWFDDMYKHPGSKANLEFVIDDIEG